ncbi:MAG TPA: 3-isopropylmalate dehydratase large subunit [bacterium]|nr:3-isopropylmalate dehydratase large subunit [bacterium]
MGMTITEKILAEHAGAKRVGAGEFIMGKIDLALGNDITAPLAIQEFEKTGAAEVFDRTKIALVPDHFQPAKDIAAAEQVKIMREFARKYKIAHFFECGRAGIEHALLPEQGLVLPGDLVIGADSHTCTYGALGAFSTGVGSTDLAAAFATGEVWLKAPETIKVEFRGERNDWVSGKDLVLTLIGRIGVEGARYQTLEFAGPAVAALTMADRFTICNMAVEAGAKNGIFAADDKTRNWIKGRTHGRKPKFFTSDSDANYANKILIEVGEITPVVALPHSPANVKPAAECGDITIDQVVVGSCTNGWIEDLRAAAKVLSGHKVHPNVRMIVIPATPIIQRQAMREGLMDIFISAGAAFSTPTCGPCLGGHMGVLAPGERAVATTNRNFVGRMGHVKSEVYLANPAVAAASAVKGRIATPEEVVKK